MKKFELLALGTWTLFLVLKTVSPCLAAETADIAAIENYGTKSGSRLPGGGEITELVRAVFDGMGLKPRIDFLPRNRAYIEARNGKYLASFPWYKDQERERDFLFSDSIYAIESRVIVPSSSDIPVFTRSAVHGKRSCDLLGSHFQAELFQEEQVTITRVSEIGQCLKMVKAKKIDFYFSPPTITKEELGTEAKIAPDDLDLILKLHLIVARTNPRGPQIIADFNRELSRLRHSVHK